MVYAIYGVDLQQPARRQQSGDEVLQVSQIAFDPIGLYIILLCNGSEEGVQVPARDRNDHANTLVQSTHAQAPHVTARLKQQLPDGRRVGDTPKTRG